VAGSATGKGGTMGAGNAIVAVRAGFPTIAYDLEAAALERARRQTEGFLRQSVERGKLSAEQLEKIVGDIVQTTELADLSACDLVIEPFSRTSRPSRSCSAP
jgi:3-hydroxybutyryl-CoA dehydrogenase